MMIKKIDHVVITTNDIDSLMVFYEKCGFKLKNSLERYELLAGDFKINVHILEKELFPHAKNVTTGSSDLCFEIEGDIEAFKKKLENEGLAIEEGIVLRSGIKGSMKSIYLRDPDGNLLEFSSYE